HTRHDVRARVATTVLDVIGELLVEELQWLVRHRSGAHELSEVRLEFPEVRLRYSFELGDDEQRERPRVLADELALAFGEELVELAVGKTPHELFVLGQSFRGE